MHRDRGLADEFEILCSIPALTVRRLRFRSLAHKGPLETGSREALVVPLAGTARVEVLPGGPEIELASKDVCYLPKESRFALAAPSGSDVVLAEAPAEKAFPVVVKRFAETKPIESGMPTYSRRIYTPFGEKDEANRFIAGFVEGASGNWTSFPPHRHDGKPEVYIYYGMGGRFGVQVVSAEEERAFVVREGDAVLFERGYHPNVATPGVGMNFLWIISADPAARNLSVELHPDYKDLPMGQTHLTTK